MCTARALYTRLAEQVGRAALKLLEVVPGMTVWELLMRDWEGRDVNQIGRQPPLSSNKATSHFPRLREATGGALGGKQPSRGYRGYPEATANSPVQPRSASVRLGQLADVFRLAGHAEYIFHTGVAYDRMLFFDDCNW